MMFYDVFNICIALLVIAIGPMDLVAAPYTDQMLPYSITDFVTDV